MIDPLVASASVIAASIAVGLGAVGRVIDAYKAHNISNIKNENIFI